MNKDEIKVVELDTNNPNAAKDLTDLLEKMMGQMSPEKWAKVEANGLKQSTKQLVQQVTSASVAGLKLFADSVKSDMDHEINKAMPERGRNFLLAVIAFVEAELPFAIEAEEKQKVAETSTTPDTQGTSNPSDSSTDGNPGT